MAADHQRQTDAPDTELDAAFARFAARGDPEALAEVFDRSAPRLALIAARLTGAGRGEDSPQDLVQSTFLQAIRSVDRFEAGRPVMPWLVRILVHEAGRRRRKKRALAGDPAMEELEDRQDPADLAAEREFAAQVHRAVETLPRPYREVLALRLIHGLQPVEIATALDRRLGTVRAQLHRGLDRLRRVLPRGLGASLAAAVLGTEGWAATRHLVVETGRTASLTSLAAWTGSGVMSKKLTIGLVTVLAVLAIPLSVPLLLGGLAADSPLDPKADVSRSAPAGGSGHPDHAASEPPGPTRAEIDAAAELPEAPVATDQVAFLGRVIARESGAPIAAAEIRATGHTFGLLVGEAAEAHWSEPPSARTTSDGTFRLVTDQPRWIGVELEIRAPGRATMRGGQDELRGGQTIDLGDVPLARSGHVRFEVADARGRPLPGCEWWLLLESPHDAPVVTMRDGRPGADCVLSGADGRSPVLELPTGTIGLARYQHARLGGIPIEPGFAPSSFVVLPGSPDRPQRVVLTVPDPDPATSITGHAVDARSRPAAGLRLGFREPTGVRHDAWIHADGRFVARDLPSDVPLDVDPPEGWHITAPISPARAGASDLHVVLEQVPTLEYQLSIRTRDDRPVTLSGLEIQRFVTADDAGGQPFLRGVVGLGSPYRAPDRDDDGSYLLKLHAGRYRAVARCSDPTLPTWNLFDLVVDATHTATTVEWPEPTDWRIRVRQRGTGQPVEGAHLEVRRLVMPGAERSLDRLEVEPLDGMARNHSDLLVLQQTVTDAQGRATLRTGTDLSTGSVVVTGAGFVARAVRLDAVPTSRELLVEVEPAGSVLGTVGPLEILEVFVGPHRMARGRAIRNRSPFDGVYVVLRALDGGPGFSRELDGSGAFRFDSVPPGDWNLSLHGRNGFPATEHPASPVRVTPGEPTPRRFHFDLETLAPGGLRILRPAGTPGLSGRRLTIALHGKADAITGMEPDATEGLLHPLVPGRYRAAITWESATGGLDQRHGYLIEDLPRVVPGSVIDWTLTPPNLGALVLTIVSARDGRPLPDRPVSLEADSEASVPLILRGTTDADGRIRWEHAPGRSLRIRVGAPGARTADHAPIADSFEVRQGTPNTARRIAIP